jgi:hypothetical protein
MRFIYFLLLLIFPLSVIAQEDSTIIHKNKVWINSSLLALYQKGYVFATNDFLKGTNIEANRINAFQIFSLKFSTQTNGDILWQQLYKYPYWGIGFYVADFYNPEEIGIPFAVYGFLTLHLKDGRS